MRIVANQNPSTIQLLEQQLLKIAPDIEITWILPDLHFTGSTEDAEILLRFEMPQNQLEICLQAMPELQWMHTVSAGVDRFFPLFLQIAPPDAVMTNGSGTMSRPIAEYVLGQIIATSKNFSFFQMAQQQHIWQHDAPNVMKVRELHDIQILIYGYGSIGKEIARLTSAVGMHVTAVRRNSIDTSNDLDSNIEQLFGMNDPWQNVLPSMQYIIISAPLTPATRHVFNAELFRKMDHSAWLMNIARGGIVDEPALIQAIQENRLGGAVLDVVETEPLPPESMLWDLPNIIITPHISWRSPQIIARGWQLFQENFRRFQRGEELLNIVPREIGY